LRPLFAGPHARLVRFRCLRDGKELAAERHHPGPVLTVGFRGASVLRSGRTTLQTDPATASWHPDGQPYETRHPWGGGCRGCHVAYERALAEELDGGRAAARPGPRAVILPPAALLRLRRLVHALGRGTPLAPLFVEEELIEVGRAALGGSAPRGRPPRHGDTRRRHQACAARARALLHERYRDPLRLDDLARAAYASPAHLTRVFRRETGLSLHAYQTRLRLSAALERVVDGDRDLSTVAHDLGFASHSHLTDAFRRAFGSPPSQVRRSLGPDGASRGRR
jgi:AraC-like DNA-binding protein